MISDLIDAHYYPDGVAAGLLAKWLGKPFFATARGTDLNLIPEYPFPRKLILKTASAASGSIGVCKALIDSLEQLGVHPVKLHTLETVLTWSVLRPSPASWHASDWACKPRGRTYSRWGTSLSEKAITLPLRRLSPCRE